MTIDEIFSRVRQLPPGMPEVAQQILQEFDGNNETDLKIISAKIAEDQMIAAKVLRLANSAYFGGARNVATLDQAVVLLGVSALRTLVIASSTAAMFPDIPGFDKQRFWSNSLQVGSLCRDLSRGTNLDANVAFVCGMLHGIGDLLIRLANPSLSADIDGYEEVGADRAESQKNLMGLDYAEVGAALAQRWDFPSLIQQAIALQLEPQSCDSDTNYAAMMAVAKHLIRANEQGMDWDDEEFYPQATADLLLLKKDKVLTTLERLLEKGDSESVFT